MFYQCDNNILSNVYIDITAKSFMKYFLNVTMMLYELFYRKFYVNNFTNVRIML